MEFQKCLNCSKLIQKRKKSNDFCSYRCKIEYEEKTSEIDKNWKIRY